MRIEPQTILGEKTPKASDCYRFALSHPRVDDALCGPRNIEQLQEDLMALERGTISQEERQWLCRIGDHVGKKYPSFFNF